MLSKFYTIATQGHLRYRHFFFSMNHLFYDRKDNLFLSCWHQLWIHYSMVTVPRTPFLPSSDWIFLKFIPLMKFPFNSTEISILLAAPKCPFQLRYDPVPFSYGDPHIEFLWMWRSRGNLCITKDMILLPACFLIASTCVHNSPAFMIHVHL